MIEPGFGSKFSDSRAQALHHYIELPLNFPVFIPTHLLYGPSGRFLFVEIQLIFNAMLITAV